MRSTAYYLPRDMYEAPRLALEAGAGKLAYRRALLISPFYAKDPRASFGKHVLAPSLALTSIAAATPFTWQVEIWDENLLNGPPPIDPLPEVVGITVHLTFAERAYELAKWYRERGSKVVLGGPHVQACPDEAAPHADAIVIGEGTAVWHMILADVEICKLAPEYKGSYRRPYREAPTPLRSALDRRSFLTTSSIIATEGCRNRCDFCYLSTQGLTMPAQARDPEQIVAELRAAGNSYAVFTDNNLGSNPKYLRRLCAALKPLGIIWSAAVTIDITSDATLIQEMALAGCTGVFLGLETLNDDNLVDANKRTPFTRDYARRIAVFREYGIQVNGSFVFGFDHDGPEVFEQTIRWIEEHRLECATFHILTPYPGTPLFKKYEREGRLLHTDWKRYDTSHAVFKPKHLTPEQLEEGYDMCYRRLYSRSSIWKRRPADWRAVPAYLAMTYLYKRSNRLWRLSIEYNLTAVIWWPLVEFSRWRHLRYRRKLERALELQAQVCQPARE